MPRTRAMGESPSGFRALEAPIRKRRAPKTRIPQSEPAESSSSTAPQDATQSSSLTSEDAAGNQTKTQHLSMNKPGLERPKTPPTTPKSSPSPSPRLSTASREKLEFSTTKQPTSLDDDSEVLFRVTPYSNLFSIPSSPPSIPSPPSPKKRKWADVIEGRIAKRHRVGEPETKNSPPSPTKNGIKELPAFRIGDYNPHLIPLASTFSNEPSTFNSFPMDYLRAERWNDALSRLTREQQRELVDYRGKLARAYYRKDHFFGDKCLGVTRESYERCQDRWWETLSRTLKELVDPNVPFEIEYKGMFAIRTNEYRNLKTECNSLKTQVIETRKVKSDSLITMILTTIDWFEKNPDAILPTAKEMSSFLENFSLSRKAELMEQQEAPAQDENRSKESMKGNAIVPLQQADHPVLDQEDPPSQENQGWAAHLGAHAVALLRKPLGVFRSPNKGAHPSNEARINNEARPDNGARPNNEARPNHGARLQRPNTSDNSARPLDVAPGSDATRSGQPRRVATPVASSSRPSAPALFPIRKGKNPDSHLPMYLRGRPYEELPPEWQAISQHMKPSNIELAGRRRAEKAWKKEEAVRAAKRAQKRKEAEKEAAEEALEAKRQRKLKKEASTGRIRSTNTFCVPFSDSEESDDEDPAPAEIQPTHSSVEVSGKDIHGKPLWIPRGVKALDQRNYLKYGTEFDLPAWACIKTPEEANGLAHRYNQRTFGERMAFNISYEPIVVKALPSVELIVPERVRHRTWRSQEEITFELVVQQEFEHARTPYENARDVGGIGMNKRMKGMISRKMATVRQKAATLGFGSEEAWKMRLKALDELEETWAKRTPFDEFLRELAEEAMPPEPELQQKRSEPVKSGLNDPPGLQKARKDAEKYKPKKASNLRTYQNMSPTNSPPANSPVNTTIYKASEESLKKELLAMGVEEEVLKAALAVPDHLLVPEPFIV